MFNQLISQIIVSLSALGIFFVYVYKIQKKHIRKVYLSWLFLFVILSTLDILLTIIGTWNATYKELNPLTRLVLENYGLVGRGVERFIWESFFIWLSYLGKSFGKWILVSVTIGHFIGVLSWTVVSRYFTRQNYIQPEIKIIIFFVGIMAILFIGWLVSSKINWVGKDTAQ